MKTEDVVLLIGAAVVGWIILQIPRRPSSTATSGTRERTGTVTAGNLTFANRPSLYSSGSYLQSVWDPSAPMEQPGWNDA